MQSPSLRQQIAENDDLTPAEQQAAEAALALGPHIQGCTAKELARAAHVSTASINRLCQKIGLSGYKELKRLVIRESRDGLGRIALDERALVDVNFPFRQNDSQKKIMDNMSALYATTIEETAELISPAHLEHAVSILAGGRDVVLYTGSHNIYPALMFEERLLSMGKRAICPQDGERQLRLALSAGPEQAAIIITYSGLSSLYTKLIAILRERHAPIVLIGSKMARRRHPGLDAYLLLSDREHLQDRITQFASHISVQYVLDTLFCCTFARNYKPNMKFLRRSASYELIAPADELLRYEAE